MTLTLELASVALLVIVAIELLLIHRDLLYLTTRFRRNEAESGGQTINVNVGPHEGVAKRENGIAMENASTVPLALATTPITQETDNESPEPEPVKTTYVPRVKATPSGQIAKRCPTCGMENSSMRSECFNCGAGL